MKGSIEDALMLEDRSASWASRGISEAQGCGSRILLQHSNFMCCSGCFFIGFS
ncbi:hypothetical protein [Candidatus Electronema sp. TJ]|uniref:hypothetical protein n=1 Tax=Candidatus Electronema sp. TJ TaxID=3401573 RepID=UPI003AA91D97